ncbi:MAG: DUF3127 domain-containing protein [Rikenellaceae bacterium]|jgi:hypothetical protein|nr:DUF3127 domain-containing protein [Rikenellaceae bacterium]
MEFEGVVFRILPPVSGTSARGVWKKQDVVFEIPGEFSRKVCVTFFGDRADDVATLREGDRAEVSVNVESREYNERWYTDVKAWKIVKKSSDAASVGASGGGSPVAAGVASSPAWADAPFNETSAPAESADVDDLPF